jgi:spermidine synthase
MAIGGLLQSGGVVADIWKRSCKFINNQQLTINNILILGLGGGTAAKVFSQKFSKAKITGVEIDPEVIRLGKKYFRLGEIKNLKIVCADAIKFINNQFASPAGRQVTINYFDLIAVDLYLGEKIPSKTDSLKFLSQLRNLLAPGGFIIFNRIFWGKHKKEAEIFVKKTKKVFKNVKLARTLANLLVICR